MQRLDGDKPDSAIGGWATARTEPPAGTRRAVAIDGKAVRGSASNTHHARHLLAAIDHRSGVVLGQLDVHTMANEITRFSCLCEGIATFADAIVTADALHTARR